MFIPCQKCGQQYTEDWTWYICDTCGYRICTSCFGSHSGPGNGYNYGGYKCSQCQMGYLRLQQGIKSQVNNIRSTSKLDDYLSRVRGEGKDLVNSSNKEASFDSQDIHKDSSVNYTSNKPSDGITLTNSRLIANKYQNCSPQEVQVLIQDFVVKSFEIKGFQWELIDLGAKEMDEALNQDASWIDYAQLLNDYSDGVGIKKSAHTPLFIIGGSDVIPMPDFYASIGHDIKTMEDSDFLYCFPIDYAWKRVSIKDAIFNVSRLPLDFGKIQSTLDQDLATYSMRS